MSARFITVCVTENEAAAARKVRDARDRSVRGYGDEALVAALDDPHVALLLGEVADAWESTPSDDDGRDI